MNTSPTQSKLDTLWFTRCAGNARGGVPTATGIAYRLGWFHEEFARDGFRLRTLQDDDAEDFRVHHYDHGLSNLIREGGNLFSIPARAQGAKTRLLGLTWIDEGQAILVREDSDIRGPADLKGKRLGLPAYSARDIADNKRGRSIARHSSLHGYKGALAAVGLTLDDVTLVEVGGGEERLGLDIRANEGGFWQGFRPLLEGKLDGFYVKGAGAHDAAKRHQLRIGVDLDQLPERRFRVNNGTPRPITVHEDLLQRHPEVVSRFLLQILRAAEWAKGNLKGVYEILGDEIGATPEGLASAYKNDFHLSLAPNLSSERLSLFRQQKDFLLKFGILDRDFDFDAWVDPVPLAEAERRLAALTRAA
ncbi:MAG: ABC transporter substrate-binding protein [Polyangiaceae bacterium]